MNKLLSPAGILLVIVISVGLVVWTSYNKLVGLQEGVDAAWSQVENVYQRRADLIPNLVNTVEGAKDFEQDTLREIVAARSRVGQVQFPTAPTNEQIKAFEASQAELSSALSRLLVVVERYPELKASEAYRDLMAQLEGAENRIAVERRRFNETVQEYNTERRRFPAVMMAGMLGFGERGYFKAAEGASTVPVVQFGQ